MLMLHDMLFPVSRNTAVFKLPACGRHASVILFSLLPSVPPHQNTHVFHYQSQKMTPSHFASGTTHYPRCGRKGLGGMAENGNHHNPVPMIPGYIQPCLARPDKLEEHVYSKTSAMLERQVTVKFIIS
jgi:hypothetical protein